MFKIYQFFIILWFFDGKKIYLLNNNTHFMEIMNYGKYLLEVVKYTYNVNRNDLIEPLTAIIRLGILSYKPLGTKISIQNNKIYLQNGTFLQGTLRSIYGDKKTDVNILYGPIISACICYLNNATKRNDYLHIFKLASSGLAKLKETYLGTDIVYNIEQIKNIIDSFINNENVDPSNFIANYQSQSYKLKTDIYKHISSIWEDKRHDMIFNLINELSESNENTKYELLNSLSYYLDFIDIKVNDIIKDL